MCTAAYLLRHSWVWFNNPKDAPEERRRGDGNSGHTHIDFGGQWLMGRMVYLGYARELYHRQRQWQVLRAGFPVEDEMPLIASEWHLPKSARVHGQPDDEIAHDADNLMHWFMGRDPPEWKTVGGAAVAPLGADPFGSTLLGPALAARSAEVVKPEVVDEIRKPAIGGPLYPPIHGFLYAPLGAIDRPRIAYRVFQLLSVLVVFLTGYGVKLLSGGRIPWSVATLIIFLFPGTRGGLDLGQNPTLSLAVVVWGWVLAARGYQFGGGMVWGLFAFKPVWGLAFFLVPLLTRRYRFCVAMVLSGCGLAAATLPFVGIQGWLDWLAVGKEAAALYKVNFNWIHLSRDVQSIPRRILHDFTKPEPERDTVLADALGWSLWGAILIATAVIYLGKGDRNRSTGIGIAFLFFGAYLTCYRFMYYDALLILMGCVALFADPAWFLRTRLILLQPSSSRCNLPRSRVPECPPRPCDSLGPRYLGYVASFPITIFVFLLIYENALSGMDLQATFGFGYYSRITTGPSGTARIVPKWEMDTGVYYPWETVMAFALWAWSGLRLLQGDERPASASPGAAASE
jgi:hypothetical protein